MSAKSRRALRVLAAIAVVVLVSAAVAAGSSGAASSASVSSDVAVQAAGNQTSSGPVITNYVKYVHGKPKAANPKLKPVEIGWVNNQGGSIIPVGPLATNAALFVV